MTVPEDVYTVAVLQTSTRFCRDRDDVRRNLDRIASMVDSAAMWAYAQFNAPQGQSYPDGHGTWAPLRLVALPELALNMPLAFFDASDVNDMIDACCINIPGSETEVLGEICKRQGFYLSCGAYESHPAFPGRIFNSQFLLGPSGEVLGVHRKYNNWIPFETSATSPHDVFDEYRAVFGEGKSLLETFFPVYDTDIGRIGMLTCNDGLYPENWRALGLQGAEIVIHGNLPEPYASPPYDWRELFARTFAVANMCYVVSPSFGAKVGGNMPEYSTGGANGSLVVDPLGRIVSQVPYPGETMTSAEVALDHMRRRRADPGSYNFFAHLRTEAYREMYSEEIYPANVLAEEPIQSSAEVARRDVFSLGVIDSLVARGVLARGETSAARPDTTANGDGLVRAGKLLGGDDA